MSALSRLGIIKTKLKKGNDNSYSENQNQTKESFGFQWHQRNSYELRNVQDFAKKWLFERYCQNDPTILDKWLSGGNKIILDAGCGAGYSAIAFFDKHLNNNDYLGVDISDAVQVAEKRFKEKGYKADFLKSDLMSLPIPDNSVDMIFSEGVLHHTDNTEKAISYLTKKLNNKG